MRTPIPLPTFVPTLKTPLEACKSTLNASLTSILPHFISSSRNETFSAASSDGFCGAVSVRHNEWDGALEKKPILDKESAIQMFALFTNEWAAKAIELGAADEGKPGECRHHSQYYAA